MASLKEAKRLDKLINTPGTSGYQPHYDNRHQHSHQLLQTAPKFLGQKNSSKQPYTPKRPFGSKGLKQSYTPKRPFRNKLLKQSYTPKRPFWNK